MEGFNMPAQMCLANWTLTYHTFMLGIMRFTNV